MKKNISQGSAVIDAIKSSSLVDLSKEYMQIGIDSLLGSNIPIVNTITGVFTFVNSVKNELFIRKFLSFLTQLSDIPEKDRISMVNDLNKDDKFSGRAGEAIIEILDRMESEKKPELAAKFFSAFASKKINFEDLRRCLFALERTPSFDIDKLEIFINDSAIYNQREDEPILLSFVNAGLGKNNGGYDGGIIIPTNLCKIFVKVITDSI